MLVLLILLDLGIGIMVGAPSGVSIKSWSDGRTSALELELSWSLTDNTLFTSLDWNRTFHRLSKRDLEVGGYIGGGPFLKTGKRYFGFGLKVPFGLDAFFKKIPVSSSIELSPSLLLIPKSDFELFGFVAIRYILK